MTLQIPTVTEADLLAFHHKTFPQARLPASFFHNATEPSREEHEEITDEHEEDPGVYPDGTFRTLTDAEIKIFRHSEIESLLKARRKRREAEAEAEAEAAAALVEAANGNGNGDGDGEWRTQWAQSVFGGRFHASLFEVADSGDVGDATAAGASVDGGKSKKKRKKRPGKGQREKDATQQGTEPDVVMKDERDGDVEEGPYGKRKADKRKFEADDGMTYRRMAREADEVGGGEAVELDY